MADDHEAWQEFQADRQQEITRAFRELRERWQGIFDQEALRWNAAVHHHEYRQVSEWRGEHAWVRKPLEAQVSGLEHALQEMREATDRRLPWEAYSGYGSFMSGPSPERQTHDRMPPRGTVAYVEWVVRDAIRTGHDEGSPLRAEQIENIRKKVWAQEIGPTPTPLRGVDAVREHAAALRAQGKGIALPTQTQGQGYGR